MPPLLSETTVLLLSCGFSASYLSSIYLVPSARIRLPSPSTRRSQKPSSDPADISTPPDERRDRNHPSVIKSRLVAVSLSSLSSLLSLPYILSKHTPTHLATYTSSIPRALELAGLVLPSSWSETLRLIALPLGLTASLFAGSLYIQYLEGDLPLQKKGGTWKSLKERFDGWRGIRNFVIASFTSFLP